MGCYTSTKGCCAPGSCSKLSKQECANSEQLYLPSELKSVTADFFLCGCTTL